MKVGLAWYDKTQWELLRGLASDPESLDNSFDEWELNAVTAECELRARGLDTERVPILVNAWAAWCKSKHKPLNGESRSEYAAHKLKERYSRGKV